jgi:hypothetical protein
MAIVGRAVKVIAGWRFERGTTLGLLEQLLASRSLWGALQAQWSLRMFNVVGAVLVALAVLSPLGGQSSLQMLKRRDVPIPSSPNITYLDTNTSSWFISGAEMFGALAPLNAMYTSSLMAASSVKNSSMDLWGNVKIPILSQLRTNPNQTGWQDVPEQGVAYSSLAGIPIIGLPNPANTTLTLETSYMDLDCYNISIGNPNSNTSQYLGVSTNTSTWFIGIDVGDYPENQPPPQRTLLLKSETPKGPVLAFCHISMAYIEAAVKCTGSSCQITSLRPTQKPHQDPKIVPLESYRTLDDFTESLVQSTGTNAPQSSSTTEFYLANPNDPLTNSYRVITSLYTLSPTQMSVRLAQVINTYYLGSLAPFDIMNPSAGSLEYINLTVTAFSTINRSTYVCQWDWWAIFFLANLAMLSTACVGAFLDWQSTGPDILGYISSMTRDSQFVKLPPGGSALGGMERARLLKDIKVQLVDSEAKDEIGRLVFATPGEVNEPPSKDRVYI